MEKAKKLLLLLALVGAGVALYLFTPIRESLSPEGVTRLKQAIVDTGPLASIAFMGLYVAACIFCLPGSALTLVAGALFGTWLGFVYVVIASNVGANAAFLIARYIGQDAASKLLRGKLSRLEVGLERNAFLVVLGLRLAPIFPFNVLNYGLGLAPVPWRDYALGSLLGMIPGTFAYVALGNVFNAVQGVKLTDPEVLRRPEVWGPFLLVIALAFVPKLFKRKLPVPGGSAGTQRPSDGPPRASAGS